MHLILRVRGVYPEEIFERRRLFDVTTFRSRHVELNDYIALVSEGLRELLERGEGDALVLSILRQPAAAAAAVSSSVPSPKPEVLERFRFEFRQLASSGPQPMPLATGKELDQVRAQLRGFLLKLHVCSTLLPPLNPSPAKSLAFACELHTNTTCSMDPLSPQLLEHWTENSSPASAISSGEARVVPLKSLATEGGLVVSLNALTSADYAS